VGQTGEALETIVGQVNDINRNVTAIVESAREQATGLKEINEAVISMDQGTQQNAAMVEESTAASHSLATEVDALNQLLATFKTGVAQRSAPTPVRRDSRPVSSPARQMVQKVSKAFASRGSAAVAVKNDNWQEF
jgi:methyl-accepting chemotaxis protein